MRLTKNPNQKKHKHHRPINVNGFPLTTPWHLLGIHSPGGAIKSCVRKGGFVAVEYVNPPRFQLKTTNLDAGTPPGRKRRSAGSGLIASILGDSDRWRSSHGRPRSHDATLHDVINGQHHTFDSAQPQSAGFESNPTSQIAAQRTPRPFVTDELRPCRAMLNGFKRISRRQVVTSRHRLSPAFDPRQSGQLLCPCPRAPSHRPNNRRR